MLDSLCAGNLRPTDPKSAKQTGQVGDRVSRETAMPPMFGKERAMGNKLRIMLGRSPPD